MTKFDTVQEVDLRKESGFSASDYRHSRILTAMARAEIPSDQMYGVWQQAVTPVSVESASGEMHTWHGIEYLRDDAEPRAAGTRPRRVNLTMGEDKYKIERFGLAFALHNEDTIENDTIYNLELAAVEKLARSYKIRQERVFADKFLNDAAAGPGTDQCWSTVVAGAAPTGTDKYSGLDKLTDVPYFDSDRDPVPHMKQHMLRMQEDYGFRPNTIFMNRRVYEALIENLAIQARLGDDKDKTEDNAEVLVRKLFGRRTNMKILVSDATYAPKGTDKGQFIYGNHVLMAHIAARPSKITATAIQNFKWKHFSKIFRTRTQADPIMLRNYDNYAHTSEFQMHGQIGLECASDRLGMLFQNVLAP